MRYKLFGVTQLGIFITIVLSPLTVSAETGGQICSPSGYTVLTINGILVGKEAAIDNKKALEERLLGTYKNENLRVDYLHNPSHLGGLGDIIKSVYQGLFDKEIVNDYDLVEMLKAASEKVKTQKILLVAHSQGNFYANSFYDTVAGKDDGTPPESIGVYSVATPSGRVAGGGKWITSDTDEVIAGIVGRGLHRAIMAPNTHIALAPEDDSLGHDFSQIYLKYRGAEIIADIEASLNRLRSIEAKPPAGGLASIDKNTAHPCLAPPPLTLGHKMEGALFAVADPMANAGNTVVVAAATAMYQTGAAAVQIATDMYHAARMRIAERVDAFKQVSFGAAAALYGSSVTLADLQETPAGIQPLPVGAAAAAPTQNTETPPAPAEKPADESTDTAADLRSAPQNPLPRQPAPTPPNPAAPKTPASNQAPPTKLAAASSDSGSRSHGNVADEVVAAGRAAAAAAAAAESTSATASSSPSAPPPAASLTVQECSSSLSADGCLLASTTVTLLWNASSGTASYYALTCQTNGAACAGFSTATTTATSTLYILPSDNATYTFKAKAYDSAGAAGVEQTQSVELAIRPVVINEIAWAGTSAARDEDEWMELYNPTNKTISLSGWILRSLTDPTPYITLSGAIPAGGFFVLERTDNTAISDITANQIYTGSLVNSGEQLILSRASTTIDQTPSLGPNGCTQWCAGSNTEYTTMERHDPYATGTNAANWASFQSFLANGKNANGAAIQGTPGKRNSANHLLSNVYLAQDTTITRSRSPYVNTGFTVPAGVTLSIEPGVVIKSYNTNSPFTVQGALFAAGTAALPIIFTSFHDDDCGISAGCGDTDATSTPASPGDWPGIKISSAAATSTFSYATIRYGGLDDSFANYYANLRVDQSAIEIKNSIIEKSKVYGLYMKNGSSGIVDQNTIRQNTGTSGTTAAGLYLISSSPTISNNQFVQNTKGLIVETSAPSVIGNTFTGTTQAAIEVANGYPVFSGNAATSNGINGVLIQNYQDRDYTFSAGLPYVIAGTYTVPNGKVLTVNAGAAVKFKTDIPSILSIAGALSATGTGASAVVFTSWKDDTVAGDTNGDGAASSPQAGDWKYISFTQSATTSTLAYATIRYGGGTAFDTDRGAIRIIGSSPVFDHATLEYNAFMGAYLSQSASMRITDSLVQYHQGGGASGLFLTSSSTPTIAGTTFKNNDAHISTDDTSGYTGTGNIFVP